MKNKSLFKGLLLGGALGIIAGMVLDTLTEQAKVDPVNNDDCSDNQIDQLKKDDQFLTQDLISFRENMRKVFAEWKQEITRNQSLQNTVKQLKEQITKLKKNESK